MSIHASLHRAAEIIQWALDVQPVTTPERRRETRTLKRDLLRAARRYKSRSARIALPERKS